MAKDDIGLRNGPVDLDSLRFARKSSVERFLWDVRDRPFFEAGRTLFLTRQGQFNLACKECHEDHWDQKLRGAPISQGYGNAYPAYRLEWQTIGSLQRRLRNCNIGVRAEPYPYGAQEYVNLELYLAWRAQGLPIETPGVRR